MYIGGRRCSELALLSDGNLVASAPAGHGTRLAIEVVVSLPGRDLVIDGGSLLFDYTPPTISRLDPPSGRVDSGDTITVLGIDFGEAPEVCRPEARRQRRAPS